MTLPHGQKPLLLTPATDGLLVAPEAYAALPASAQQWPLQRVGPQVLRNTAIVTWLQAGVSEDEVVRRIGVESSRALGHLQHKLAGSAPDVFLD